MFQSPYGDLESGDWNLLKREDYQVLVFQSPYGDLESGDTLMAFISLHT